jgi:hypothetical protein
MVNMTVDLLVQDIPAVEALSDAERCGLLDAIGEAGSAYLDQFELIALSYFAGPELARVAKELLRLLQNYYSTEGNELEMMHLDQIHRMRAEKESLIKLEPQSLQLAQQLLAELKAGKFLVLEGKERAHPGGNFLCSDDVQASA